MKILVACEESQAVTIELRKLGHEAYSCDIVDCSGGHPEWHIRQDVLPLLDGDCVFFTYDGEVHSINGEWDMIIAFPPCTYLTVSGNRWFNVEKYGEKAILREKDRQTGKIFFMRFANANCDKIAIENPVGIMSTEWRKPNQIIQPYMFGSPYTKKTCLWLIGLNNLEPTEILTRPECGWKNQQYTNGRYSGFGKEWGGQSEDGTYRRYGDPELKQIRSKTFPGIAKAIAEQWAGKAKEAQDDEHNTERRN